MVRPINKFTIPFNQLGAQPENAANWILRSRYNLSDLSSSGAILGCRTFSFYVNDTYYLYAIYGSASHYVFTSTDGVNWTSNSFLSGYDITGISYTSGNFYAFTANAPGYTLRSTNGISSWTSISSQVAATYLGVANNIMFTWDNATGQNQVVSSSNGITWTQRLSGIVSASAVAYGNGVYAIVSGGDNSYYTSSNLTAWTLRNTGNLLVSIFFKDGYFYLLDFLSTTGSLRNFRLRRSTDAVNWTVISDHSAYLYPYHIYGNFSFDGNLMLYSGTDFDPQNKITYRSLDNGLTWSSQTNPSIVTGGEFLSSSIVYGNKMFAMIGLGSAKISIFTAKR